MVDLWCTVRVWLEEPDERSRQRVRGPAPGRKFKVTERFRGPPELQRSFQSLRDIFSDRSRRFPINKGEGRGAGSELFSDFFFFASLGGGEGGGGTPKPEARVARFLVGMFRNRIFWGGETEKVSPKVLLDQSIDEKVSPNFYIFKLTEVKKCHQM